VPVYCGEKYLTSAIESVLKQDYQAMELIAIDDGSADNSWNILSQISDPRVKVLRKENQGLSATLNLALSLARCRYIARQDQDDLMLPGRLARQVEFLDNNPDCALVGTWSEIWVGDQPSRRRHQHPSSHEALRLELLFDNPFVHSSVMMRADVIRELGGYCEDRTRQPPEDYDLWSRVARDYRVANIPDVLTVYREVDGSMSRTGVNPFLDNVILIASENIYSLLSPHYTKEQCLSLASLYHGRLHIMNLPAPRESLHMLEQAAMRIAGPASGWSDEFIASYDKLRGHLLSQSMRRRIPHFLLGRMRRMKRLVSEWFSSITGGG
jgi:glycosyltransferase involved in cell wall biosynthesis